MDKDKPIDRKENNIENKKEDYKDSNGNPEDFIEDMTESEATDIFKEAFYAEGKALEEEALRSSFVEDEEKKEALRLRILAAAGRSTAENTVLEHKASLENQSNDTVANKAVVRETATESASGETMTVSETSVRKNDTEKDSVEDVKKKKKRSFTLFMRWAAVLALVCLGVFGVSVTGQAKESGLWSSIQRLIGMETRWEQDDNGEDRTYTSAEEEKAIREIEEKLNIDFPIFFYWPKTTKFSGVEMFENTNNFIIKYSSESEIYYLEGWIGKSDISSINVWQGESIVTYIEEDEIIYTITESKNDIGDCCYYVNWNYGDNSFLLSGMSNLEDVKKIIKNIKN